MGQSFGRSYTCPFSHDPIMGCAQNIVKQMEYKGKGYIIYSNMPSFKLYDALGLQRGASVDQIKGAYKKLAIQNHPDKGGDVEKFKEISAAYNVLSDDGKRKDYDQHGDEGPQHQHHGQHHFNPHDIFAQMFANGGMGGGMPFDIFGRQANFARRQRSGVKCQDHSHDIHIPLREAYFGANKGVKIQLEKICFSCKDTCPVCQGLGNVTQMIRNGPFTQIIEQRCDACSGSGNVSKGSIKCGVCAGKCKYTEEKRVEVNIKPGVPEKGFRVSVDGAGEQPRNASDTAGDLHINIIVKDVDSDHKLTRYGSAGEHLLICNTLTLAESILGKTVAVPHFTGNIDVDTRSHGIIQPGKEYIVKGKGMPKPKSSSEKDDEQTYGDLILKFDIQYPINTVLTNEECEALSKAFTLAGIV